MITRCTSIDYIEKLLQPTFLSFGNLLCQYCAKKDRCAIQIKPIKPFVCASASKMKDEEFDYNKNYNPSIQDLAKFSLVLEAPPLSFVLPSWFSRFISRFTTRELDLSSDVTLFLNPPRNFKKSSRKFDHFILCLLNYLKPDHPKKRLENMNPKDRFLFFHPVFCSVCKEKMKHIKTKVDLNNKHIREEIYKCDDCCTKAIFQRTTNPKHFQKIKYGRCGEFSQYFKSLCNHFN